VPSTTFAEIGTARRRWRPYGRHDERNKALRDREERRCDDYGDTRDPIGAAGRASG